MHTHEREGDRERKIRVAKSHAQNTPKETICSQLEFSSTEGLGKNRASPQVKKLQVKEHHKVVMASNQVPENLANPPWGVRIVS